MPPTDGPSRSQLSSLGFYRGKGTLGVRQAFDCFPPKPAHQHSQRPTGFISPFPSSAALLRFSSAISPSACVTPHPPCAPGFLRAVPGFPRAAPVSTCRVAGRGACEAAESLWLLLSSWHCRGAWRVPEEPPIPNPGASCLPTFPAEPHPTAKQPELRRARPFAQEPPVA